MKLTITIYAIFCLILLEVYRAGAFSTIYIAYWDVQFPLYAVAVALSTCLMAIFTLITQQEKKLYIRLLKNAELMVLNYENDLSNRGREAIPDQKNHIMALVKKSTLT